MPISICCTQFIRNVCIHPAAPQRFARPTECILLDAGNDPRIDYSRCKLQIPIVVVKANHPQAPPRYL